MLKTNPEVGQFIRVLKSESSECGNQYQTKGDIHEIVGVSDRSGNPYFIGDAGDREYIDDAVYDLYELVKNPNVSTVAIKVCGVDVSAWDYYEEVTDFSLKFRLATDAGKDTLRVIGEFQDDIIKLIEKKYN